MGITVIISGNLLPELGVERVSQTTFVDFIFELVGKKYKMVSPDEKLVSFINGPSSKDDEQNQAMLKWASAFKGSLIYKDIIDRYVGELEQNFVPREDFKLGEYTILSADEIRHTFVNEYGFFPVYRPV